MATGPLDRVFRDIRGAAARQEVGGLADGELLGRFLARRDEPSFAELVRRHGPMVLAVCRRFQDANGRPAVPYLLVFQTKADKS